MKQWDVVFAQHATKKREILNAIKSEAEPGMMGSPGEQHGGEIATPCCPWPGWRALGKVNIGALFLRYTVALAEAFPQLHACPWKYAQRHKA